MAGGAYAALRICSENDMAQKRHKIGKAGADDMEKEKRYTVIVR